MTVTSWGLQKCQNIFTSSWKMCTTSARVTSVTTSTSRIPKNCRAERRVTCHHTGSPSQHLRRPPRFLTVIRRQRCSLRAPRQPRKPVTMVMPPATSSRLAAESDGKDRGREENSAWVKDSQTPTPNKPHPPSFRETQFTAVNFQVFKTVALCFYALMCLRWGELILTQKIRLNPNIKYLKQHKHLWVPGILRTKHKQDGEKHALVTCWLSSEPEEDHSSVCCCSRWQLPAYFPSLMKENNMLLHLLPASGDRLWFSLPQMNVSLLWRRTDSMHFHVCHWL